MGGKTYVGKVISDRMQKSVLVVVDYFKAVPKYKTKLLRHTKLMAHDEHDDCRIGDLVRVADSRPLSRHKAHVVTEILHRAPVFDARRAGEAAAAAAEQARAPSAPIRPAAILGPQQQAGRGFAASASGVGRRH